MELIFRGKARRRYGSNAPSLYLPGRDGMMGLFVLSDGCLEQAEIDYIVEAHKEKETERIRKLGKFLGNPVLRARMDAAIKIALQAKPGERHEVIKEVLKQKERVI